ncbi:hypothetical protein [Hominisplanchenecus murintestinalis]|uniref:hypothetical protein n=1 Tax=Hominisplanchenecus murintestinalis TaxID=2941517 RepID=UPI00204138F9|nr:hypothetical protein [Hominisplanchenecus murintestinalis]
MGALRPTGVPLVLDGMERHLLFTLNAIDEIQERSGAPLEEVMGGLTDIETAEDTLRLVLLVLLNDEVERLSYKGRTCDLELVDEKQIGWMLTRQNLIEAVTATLRAYGSGLPEPDDDDPNREGGRQEE